MFIKRFMLVKIYIIVVQFLIYFHFLKINIIVQHLTRISKNQYCIYLHKQIL